MPTISHFMEHNFRHFNARETLAAAKGWVEFADKGGKMVVCLAGAMSTAEIGVSLAPLIRTGKVHAITCTGANIEEDIFNLVGNSRYKLQPNWRFLDMKDDMKTREEGFNRVTDTCIPDDVMMEVYAGMSKLWKDAEAKGESYFHWEYFYKLIRNGFFKGKNDVPEENSWLLAACDMDIPVYTPGMEDSTIGNMFTADMIKGKLKNYSTIKPGTEQFAHLTAWYLENDKKHEIGFFQIGGGIAGDFAMCVVPGLLWDHKITVKPWRYFCHIGDSTTSFGSYSGCPPNEKVTWHKLDLKTVDFTINSDASIVAPLIFTYVLENSSAEKVTKKIAERDVPMVQHVRGAKTVKVE
ncbi:deoxyhypusine synthase family protein [Candidatus Peregrinibacteria bacterium]|nr:deoxyhypusine synthase family protein [Candidatus Peregrinibacteria bacterium]